MKTKIFLKKQWFVILCIITNVTIFAQTPQKDLWVLGDNVINFNSGGISSVSALPKTIYSSSFDSWNVDYNDCGGSSNSYHDSNGNLLFYIANGKVYDWEGKFI